MSNFDIVPLPGHPGMFARRVIVNAWQAAGSPPVNSAGRLYAEQKHFWDGWAKRLPGFFPADNPDDERQRLAHVRFVALDIDPTAERVRRLSAAGLIRPYSYEPWHWEVPNVYAYSIVRTIPASANITPIEEDDMTPEQDALLRKIADHQRPIRELVETPDGTLWYCYERLFRYGIRREDAGQSYQAHLKNLGWDGTIVKASHTRIESYGVPIFTDQTQRIAHAVDSLIDDEAILAAITAGDGVTVGAVDLQPLLDRLSALPAEIRAELGRTLSQ